MQGLSGKTAIVTGATAGIGRAISVRLVAEGARVVVVARGESDGARLLAELPDGQAAFVPGDVADPSTAAAAVSVAVDQFGSLDVLVNNAGIDHTGELLRTPIRDVRRVFDVNFFGALTMLQIAGRTMTDGASIINVTSRLAAIGVPTMALYGASKGALDALTRHAAVELAPLGIRVNAVAPGLTATPLVTAWLAGLPAGEEERAKRAIPQGRFGTPDEIAATIAFLASDEALHITGASIAVDGGYTAA
jgi:NAD(P)-dependent dehydrogenase (short-subunit alcohol dehydrogenase family)